MSVTEPSKQVSKLIQQFKAARRVSTPLVALRTPDAAATISSLAASFNGSTPPIVQWDIVRGLTGFNEAGVQAVGGLGENIAEVSANPVEALVLAAQLPARSILFAHNGHRVIGELPVTQAVWNLRDVFKVNQRTLVLLCPAETGLGCELTNDVLVLDEPLPDEAALGGIVAEQFQCAELPAPTTDDIDHAVSALCGLAAFPAEQSTAMCLTKQGLDLPALWERKRQTIEQTPGLSVWRGGEGFESIGGVGNVKQFLSRVISGKQAPRLVVWIDEIEKALGGSSGDTSGVSQDQLGVLLGHMQDTNAAGCVFVGPPGTAKSAVAKATGQAAGVPTVALDLGGMKGSLVGESEGRVRAALKVIEAMGQHNVLWLATCNSIGVLPPELRRRFTFGTFFFDLPTEQERRGIWTIYRERYGLQEFASLLGGERVQDEGWTGAEIKQCCELAYRLQCSLTDASAYIVPVARSAADQVEKLRQQANGRFISATYGGVYRYDKNTQPAALPAGRSIQMED